MWVVSLLGYLGVFLLISLIGLGVLRAVKTELTAADYFIAKVLGLAVVGLPLWWLGYSHLIALSAPIIWINLVGLALAATLFLRKKAVAINWRAWLLGEVVFAVLVTGFILLRGYYPSVIDGEKPMEAMMLGSVMRAPHLPPEDAWLAGESLNYYYYGYFLFGSLGKALGASVFLIFNFGLATIWALSLLAIGYVGWLITKRPSAILFAPLSYGLLANFTAFGRLITHRGETYNWWLPSRALPGTITEFPAFSYLFGDFHAHMIASVWLLALVAILANLTPKAVRWWHGLVVGLVAGQIFAISSWSALTAGLILLIAAVWLRPGWKVILAATVAAVAVVWPYQTHLVSIWQGIGWTPEHSPLSNWLGHWLLILLGLGAFVLSRPKFNLAWVLLIVGAVLVALADIFIVKDIYGGRFNTVFKLYWDAWLCLSLVAGLGLAWAWDRAWWGKMATSAVCLMGLGYLFLSLSGRYEGFNKWYGGDPAALTFAKYPELAAPYETLEGSPAGTRLFDRVGSSYGADNYLSAFTGVPTILGWKNHEGLWRGDFGAVEARAKTVSEVAGCNIGAELQRQYALTYCYEGNGVLRQLKP